MHTTNKMKSVAASIMLIGGIIAGGAHFDRTAEMAKTNPGPEVLELLGRHIPFTLEAVPALDPGDDALGLDVIVQLDENGLERETIWRAMDGETVLLECSDFYDLYYRCDGPALLNIRHITRDHTGHQIATRHGVIAIH